MAAMLARRGYTASHDALEHRQGFFNVFNGAGNYDADAVLRDWAERSTSSRRASPSRAIRAAAAPIRPSTPCSIWCARIADARECRSCGVLDASANVSRTPTSEPAQRARCEVQCAILPGPRAGGRQVVLSHFNDDAYLDARVADVMARIEAAPHPQMSSAGTAHFGAEVTVTTTDGRRLVKVVDSALGRTSEQPLPRSASRQSIAIAPAVC